jgi:hypothetical protein
MLSNFPHSNPLVKEKRLGMREIILAFSNAKYSSLLCEKTPVKFEISHRV